MKYLCLLSVLSVAMVSTAVAGNPCGNGGCKPSCCRPPCEDSIEPCKPVIKRIPIEKSCFNVETKKIVIPPTAFPWDPDPCAQCNGNGINGDGGKCGSGQCGNGGQCGAGQCGAGCGPDRDCEKRGLLDRLLRPFGRHHCKVKCIKILKKSKIKIGEHCICEWQVPDCEAGGCKPACAAPEKSPPGSAPAYDEKTEEEKTAPPPPKEARRFRFLR